LVFHFDQVHITKRFQVGSEDFALPVLDVDFAGVNLPSRFSLLDLDAEGEEVAIDVLGLEGEDLTLETQPNLTLASMGKQGLLVEVALLKLPVPRKDFLLQT